MGFTLIKATQLGQTPCYRLDNSKYGDSFKQTHVSQRNKYLSKQNISSCFFE